MSSRRRPLSVTADAIVLALEGELCIAELPALRASIDALVDGGTTRIVLDLGGVTLLTAAALRVFDTTQHRLEALGGSLALRDASPFFCRIIEIGGLDALLEENSAEAGPAS